MSFLYNFGLSQEDERTELAALHLASGDRVISIASAGEMPLSLAALSGAEVTAVDIDPAQMALTRLKYASVQCLPREDAIRFLGYMPMQGASRKECYHEIRPALAEETRNFWDAAETAILKGPIWASRFERYVKWLRRLAIPSLGRRRFERLFECTSTQEQEALFDTSLDRSALRLVFRVAFNPRVYSKRGMDPRSLAHRDRSISLGDQFYSWFRRFCTGTLAHENHLLQLTLLGQSLNPDAVPAYLSAEGYEVLHNHPHLVRFHCGDIGDYLESVEARYFNRFHLSNICDWLDQFSFERVMRLLAQKSAAPGRAVWRFLHVDRAVPDDVADIIVVKRALGERLRLEDRYPFYTILPAEIGS